MENLRKRKSKKTLITKILILLAFALIISLFCVVIAQTVKINNLNKKISDLNETYQSETTEENS